MSYPINDLLTSAKILAEASGDRMLSYLIEMALLEARESKPFLFGAHKQESHGRFCQADETEEPL